MTQIPMYDPEKTFEENFEQGPSGDFADGKIFQTQGEPEYDFFGNKLFLPFGIPNGPLINSKYVTAALDKGFDLVEYKDVRSRKLACNPMPNLLAIHPKGEYTLEQAEQGILTNQQYEQPISAVNSYGIPSMAPDFWQEDLKKAMAYAKKGQLVIAGVQATLQETGGFEAYLEDFVLDTKLVKETNPKVVEVNLSCPNEGAANLLCFDIERSQKVTYAVKNVLGNIPLIIKIAYFPDKKQLQKFVQAVGSIADAIAAINTIPTKVLDQAGQNAFPDGRKTGGACGYAIQKFGLETTKNLKQFREELRLQYKIIGIGGVTKPEDYITYKDAGADVIMSAIGAMRNPYLAQEIKALVK